jgi:hypothetical protein
LEFNGTLNRIPERQSTISNPRSAVRGYSGLLPISPPVAPVPER